MMQSRESVVGPETGHHRMTRKAPTGRIEWTAGEAMASLKQAKFDPVDAIYLLDGEEKLKGFIPLAELVAAPDDSPLAGLAHPAFAAHAEDDQESIASLAIRHGLGSVPIVDPAGRLMGVVPARDLIHILRREHIEDIHLMAGVRREAAHAALALEEPPARRVHDRLPWLLVGLAGSAVATFIVARFERALESRIAVAFFIPGIVYLADAIGTQTEAIAVRGVLFSHTSLPRLLWGELKTGTLIGLSLAALIFPLVWISFGDPRLALAVASSVAVAGALATTIGFALPWALAHAGKDPAYGSGPVATVIQDVLSLLVYFAIVGALLG